MLWPLAEFGNFPHWLTILSWIVDVGIRVLLLGIVPGGRRPAVAMAWLLVIFFLPLPAWCCSCCWAHSSSVAHAGLAARGQ